MTRIGVWLLALSPLLGAGPAAAQDSLLVIRPDAQVGSVGFRFGGTRSFSEAELGRQIALQGRGSLYGLRRVLGELPLVPSPGRYRFDPVELIERQNATRLAELVPIRHARMAQSAFAFYRGTAGVMASDLGVRPNSGITVQLCGDAHLSNFGAFGSPERPPRSDS